MSTSSDKNAAAGVSDDFNEESEDVRRSSRRKRQRVISIFIVHRRIADVPFSVQVDNKEEVAEITVDMTGTSKEVISDPVKADAAVNQSGSVWNPQDAPVKGEVKEDDMIHDSDFEEPSGLNLFAEWVLV